MIAETLKYALMGSLAATSTHSASVPNYYTSCANHLYGITSLNNDFNEANRKNRIFLKLLKQYQNFKTKHYSLVDGYIRLADQYFAKGLIELDKTKGIDNIIYSLTPNKNHYFRIYSKSVRAHIEIPYDSKEEMFIANVYKFDELIGSFVIDDIEKGFEKMKKSITNDYHVSSIFNQSDFSSSF